MEADMLAEQQDPLAVTVVAAYLGVQACKSSSGSWQAHLKDVPTVDGSSCCFVSDPLPTAAAAAQQYDKLVIALLGRGYVAEGTNVNFAPEEYTDEDVSAAAQLLLKANTRVMLDKNYAPAAAAAAAALPAKRKAAALGTPAAAVPHPASPDSVVYIKCSPDDDDYYDSALAAAAGAAIAARRAAAAAARAEQQRQQQLEQQQRQQHEEELLRQHSYGETDSLPSTMRNTRKRRRRASAPVQSAPAAAAPAEDDDQVDGSDEECTDNLDFEGKVPLPIVTPDMLPLPAAAAGEELHLHSWLQQLVLCDYLFKPCQYCTGKRMERPSAGRDKLIRFFCPADPSRGYCNYCPELPVMSDSLISVGRAEQNSVRAHYIRLTDIHKLYNSSSSGSSSSVISSMRVQAYPIGGHRVLFLRCRDPRKQLRNYKKGGKCVVDGRALKDTNCQYCSLTCKLVTEIPGFSKVLKHGARGGLKHVVKIEADEQDMGVGIDIAAAAAAAAAAADADENAGQEGEAAAAADDDERDAEAADDPHADGEHQGVNGHAAQEAAADHQQQQEDDIGHVAMQVDGNVYSQSPDDHHNHHHEQQQQQKDAVNVAAAVTGPAAVHSIHPSTMHTAAAAAGSSNIPAVQQQQQSVGIPSSSMHILMPSGNQVQVVTDQQGNSLLLHIPTAAAAER